MTSAKLTLQQQRVLAELPGTMAEIAKALGWTRSATMAILSRLRRRRLVRASWIEGGLASEYSLTPEGAQAWAESTPNYYIPAKKTWDQAFVDGSLREALQASQTRRDALETDKPPRRPNKDRPRFGQSVPKADPAKRLKLRRAWGKTLREERVRLKLSQSELARKLGIPQSRIGMAENGGGSLNSFLDLVEALGFEFRLVKT